MYVKTKWSIGLLLIFWCCSVGTAQENLREMMMEAQSASQSGDFEKAIEILRKIEEERPDNVQTVFMLGYNLHAAGKLDEAIKYHKKAASEGNGELKILGMYNLACAYSLKDEKDKAFEALENSIKAGYHSSDQTAHAKTDPDFKNIKDDPRFADMIAMMENGGKKPEQKAPTKKDLFGSWQIDSGMKSGSKIDASRLPMIEINDKSFLIPAGGDQKFVMSYKVKMDAKPIEVDFKIESGPVPEGNAKGIIKIEKNQMHLCYEPTGKERPKKFESTEENKCFFFKLKRKSSKVGIAKDILGSWKCIKGTRAGEDVAAERMASVITIDEKLIKIPVGPDQAFEMSYEIDTDKSPVAIDMKIEAGPAPAGSAALGIIKMEDGKFFLCYDPNGAERPDKFESTAQNGRFLFEMKSEK